MELLLEPTNTVWSFPFPPQDWEQTPPAVQAYVRTLRDEVAQLHDRVETLAACRRERARRYVPSCPCSVDGYSSRSQRAVGCRTRIRDAAQRVLSGHRADNHLR